MRGKLDKQPIITKQKPIRASRNRIKADRKLGPNFPKTLRAMDEMDVGEADPVFSVVFPIGIGRLGLIRTGIRRIAHRWRRQLLAPCDAAICTGMARKRRTACRAGRDRTFFWTASPFFAKRKPRAEEPYDKKNQFKRKATVKPYGGPMPFLKKKKNQTPSQNRNKMNDKSFTKTLNVADKNRLFPFDIFCSNGRFRRKKSLVKSPRDAET